MSSLHLTSPMLPQPFAAPALAQPTQEVQGLRIVGGNLSGGSYTLSFNGQTTSALPMSAAAEEARGVELEQLHATRCRLQLSTCNSQLTTHNVPRRWRGSSSSSTQSAPCL